MLAFGEKSSVCLWQSLMSRLPLRGLLAAQFKGADMEARSARFSLSEDDLEGFISGLWLALERHQLPSPVLHLDSAAGATTIELHFTRSGDLNRALENLTAKGRASASL